MRVKIESIAPLPHVRAWFSSNTLQTIRDLKTSLCADLRPFEHANIRADDIVLLLDDFELLDLSPIDLVRDGDLIVIKKLSNAPTNKRKTSSQDSSPARKRTKTEDGSVVPRPSKGGMLAKHAHLKQPTTLASSSSDSSPDSETSSSSSDSTSDSDTNSDSDSSSSSGTSSAPSTKTSQAKPHNGMIKASKTQKTVVTKHVNHPPPVPPGFGKPATHGRNLRRRRKKMYERLALTTEPASVNETPLGARAGTMEHAAFAIAATLSADSEQSQPQPEKAKGKEKLQDTSCSAAEPPLFMMATLQNKNKRRGFKDALKRGVPEKITFTDPQETTVTRDDVADVPLAETFPYVQESPQRPLQPRIIPPSEKQELGQLPPYIFVTSVDVEEGRRSSRQKNKQKMKKKSRVEEIPQEMDESFANGLPYDDEAAAAASLPVPSMNSDEVTLVTGRAMVAARWDSLRNIMDKAQVTVGTTVAWKALGINPSTLTPEMILHVARVTQCGEQVAVELISELVQGEVSFWGAVAVDEDEVVQETFSWSDVLQGDWRLVASR